MKRELHQNVKVLPYASGEAVDRNGYLSAILAVKAAAAGKLTVTVTHGDTDAAADTVTDEFLFPGSKSENGVCDIEDVQAGDTVNFDIDLLGVKRYVKIAVSGAAAANATCALALGDNYVQPV